MRGQIPRLPIAKPPSIRIYQPLGLGGRYVTDVTRNAVRYRHTIRLYGGYWTATWEMELMSPGAMVNFFKQRIGSDVQMYAGGIRVWEGLIWSMDLIQKGVVRRITLDKVRNAIKCLYTDVSDDARKETSYYTNSYSIDRYGRIEEIVYLDKTTTAAAEAYAQTVLAESALPMPLVVAVREPKLDEPVILKVSAVGYAFTLNYQYLSIADSTVTIPTAISSALSTDSDYVIEGSLDSNSVQVRPPDTETKVLDWLIELAEIGDGTQPYTIQILNDRRLFYKALDAQPTMKWDGNNLTTWAGRSLANGIWSARPGILRDLTWDNVPLPSTYFLENQRDSFVSEVEGSVEYFIPLLRADDQPDSDMIVALTRAQAALDRE